MLYFFFISSAMINIINVNWTIKTFCIFTEMNCLFNNLYRNKTSKISPSHIIPFLVSSLYSDTQHYPTISIELLLELMVRLELTAY